MSCSLKANKKQCLWSSVNEPLFRYSGRIACFWNGIYKTPENVLQWLTLLRIFCLLCNLICVSIKTHIERASSKCALTHAHNRIHRSSI